MMKLILTVALASLLAAPAFAGQVKKHADESNSHQGQALSPGGTDGCGLGWQVTDKKTWMGTSTRGTTNATIPPTFGMTSGTIGCEQHPIAKNDQEAAVYAYNNYDSLSVEMAQGHGEYLDGLAKTMGCGDTAAFGKMTQSNYKQITQGPTALDMFEAVKARVVADPSSCNAII